MPKSFWFVFLWIALIPQFAWANQEVIATGTASIQNGNTNNARTQALQDAQRNAVEQGVGALVDSKTLSQNFEIVKDQIYSSSRGFVTKYEVLSEGPSSDGYVYQIKIKATVAKDLLKNKLAALKILHQKMGNKRIMVIYQKQDPNSLSRVNGAVQLVGSEINQQLNNKGFRVFNEQHLEEVYTIIEKTTVIDRPDDQLLAVALEHRADTVVAFEVIAGKRGRSGGQFYAAKVTLKVDVYDASTGRQIASEVAYDKELSLQAPGAYDLQQMLGKAGTRAAQKSMTQIIDKIIEFYQNTDDLGKAYMMVFRNFSQNEEDLILDYLESIEGFKSLTELKNSPDYLEIEYFSSQSKSRLRRQMRRDLAQRKIRFTSQETAGNRLILVKEGSIR